MTQRLLSKLPNYFYGFSFDGILLAFSSGCLVGIGLKMMRNHHDIVNDDDVIQIGKGSGIFTLGLYCWVPPLIRKYYLVLPLTFRSKHDTLGLSISFANLVYSGIGMSFAGFTGLILGCGYGYLVCDKRRENFHKRIWQCSQGCAVFMSGIFLMSPSMLKALWITSYFLVDDK